MDVPRNPKVKRARIIKRIVFGALAVVAVAAVSYGVTKLQPAAQEVERGSVYTDAVRRGPMIRQVRGLGTLVPVNILFIPAHNDGRVDKIFMRPGTLVKPDTVLLELANPELKNAAVDAEFTLKQAEAAYTDLRVQLQSQSFDKQAVAAQVNSDYVQAKLKADRDTKLAGAGLLPDVDLKLSVTQAEVLAERDQIEKKRLGIIDESVQAQLAAQKVKIEQLKALYQLKLEQVAGLQVRAGATGVLQELPVEVGQQVVAGAILAKVTQPQQLKAQVKVTETEAKDVLIGQSASIDTRNGIIPGKVIRIDPAAVAGTVLVDVSLEGELPPGARPDLSVDGTIELEHLTDILYVGRPSQGQANTTVSLFKLTPDGQYAVKTPVKFGRTSVNTIEVLGGLQAGDTVILSAMDQYDKNDRIRLK